jgi:hypothetical protein
VVATVPRGRHLNGVADEQQGEAHENGIDPPDVIVEEDLI